MHLLTLVVCLSYITILHFEQVKRRWITVTPQPPAFSVSPRINVTIDGADHTVVYGPFVSPRHELALFPYAHDAGAKFYNQNYTFHLASNSRIMNPLRGPKISDDNGTRVDYFSKQKVSQKNAGSIQKQLLGTLCGEQLDAEGGELFEELFELLTENKVCFESIKYARQWTALLVRYLWFSAAVPVPHI